MNARWKHLAPGATVEWPTPPDLYARLNEEFHFTMDPCPIDGTEDGLATLFKSWENQRVYCNPPYGPKVDRWLERALEAEIAVLLIPARTDTKAFHDWILPRASEIRFIRGRLKFGGSQQAAPFASMLVIYQKNWQGEYPLVRAMDA